LLEGRGGLCWIDGRAVVVMDEKLPVPDRIGVLAGALAALDTEVVALQPPVRAAIDAARRRRKTTRGRKRAPKRVI
jgi:hypothetical protein